MAEQQAKPDVEAKGGVCRNAAGSHLCDDIYENPTLAHHCQHIQATADLQQNTSAAYRAPPSGTGCKTRVILKGRGNNCTRHNQPLYFAPYPTTSRGTKVYLLPSRPTTIYTTAQWYHMNVIRLHRIYQRCLPRLYGNSPHDSG